MTRKSLEILKSVDFRSSCPESWDKMTGGEKERQCLKCRHAVINLSAFTQDEAESLLAKRPPGKFCVRFTATADGGVHFQPSRSLLSRAYQAVSALSAALMAVIGANHVVSAQESNNSHFEIESGVELVYVGGLPTIKQICADPRKFQTRESGNISPIPGINWTQYCKDREDSIYKPENAPKESAKDEFSHDQEAGFSNLNKLTDPEVSNQIPNTVESKK